MSTNLEELASYFSFRCPGLSDQHVHGTVRGIECEHTGKYTLAIAMIFHLAIARNVLGKLDLMPINANACASPRGSETSEDSEPDRPHVIVHRSHHRLAITNNI